jgi:hypothetical protein
MVDPDTKMGPVERKNSNVSRAISTGEKQGARFLLRAVAATVKGHEGGYYVSLLY